MQAILRRAYQHEDVKTAMRLLRNLAREARGRVEAAAERRRAAAELDLPMARGKVLFPDAQIEYVTAAGVGEVDQARNAERTER